MKTNISLIGMPGSGKSTVGVLLAKSTALDFVDTDIIIQHSQGKALQQILDESSYLRLREIEEAEVASLNLDKHVIATGGSVVYGPRAMENLRKLSTVVYLKVTERELVRRINNWQSRGIAKAEDQSFHELFLERTALYERYADYTVDCDGLDLEGVVARVRACLVP